jgi:hypothetical protein
MKLHKYIYLSCLVCLVTGITGCKKNLEEHPQTFVSPDAFFKDTSSYNLAVTGIYSSLPLYDGNIAMLTEMCTDIYGTPAPSFEQALPMYQNAPADFYYNTREAWANPYTIIKNANFVLDALPSSTLATTKKNQLIAEASFLRAYAYFFLVQLYGDVPMPVKAVSSNENLQMPRTPQADIYKLILSDLTFAEANLPDVAPIQGRAYKLVASALLAKVYLTMAGNPMKQTAYYQNAKDEALKVISSGKFALVPDYASVFHQTTYTSESIWEKSYQVALGGNPVHGLCLTAATYRPLLLPGSWFINSFSKGDRRSQWGIVQNYPAPGGGVLAPFFQKYEDTTGISKGATSSATIVSYNFIYLRLAEMYLIAAEAENEINGPQNAYQYINIIRQRARVDKSDPTNVPDLAGLTQDQFRQAVWKERKWELVLEGSSWMDMKRENTFQNIQTIRGSGLINPIGTYNQTWLIPDNEVVNNNIPQNPLY